ncbi:MAG: hypothetical protein JNL34_06320, partial [Anaerolineae bacterium]|nr:hypothetical protein [Anaerolineae bacterium]
MPAPAVLHLLSLECLLAQEFDGDEIYLRLNGEKVWGVDRHAHMSHNMAKAHCYNMMDFAAGRRHNAAGWEPIPSFEPGALTWSFDGEALVEVFEADTLSSDDLIGRQRMSSKDAGRGSITVHFERDGAKYALT